MYSMNYPIEYQRYMSTRMNPGRGVEEMSSGSAGTDYSSFGTAPTYTAPELEKPPVYTAPEWEESAIDTKTQKKAGTGIRSARWALNEAMSRARGASGGNVKRYGMTLAQALKAHSGAIGDALGVAEKAAGEEYTREYGTKARSGEINYQALLEGMKERNAAKNQAALANYQGALTGYGYNFREQMMERYGAGGGTSGGRGGGQRVSWVPNKSYEDSVDVFADPMDKYISDLGSGKGGGGTFDIGRYTGTSSDWRTSPGRNTDPGWSDDWTPDYNPSWG